MNNLNLHEGLTNWKMWGNPCFRCNKLEEAGPYNCNIDPLLLCFFRSGKALRRINISSWHFLISLSLYFSAPQITSVLAKTFLNSLPKNICIIPLAFWFYFTLVKKKCREKQLLLPIYQLFSCWLSWLVHSGFTKSWLGSHNSQRHYKAVFLSFIIQLKRKWKLLSFRDLF